MSELLQIQQLLAERGLGYITPVALSHDTGTLFIEVPRDRLDKTASNEKTSNRQLAFVAKTLGQKFGVQVIVTIRDAQALDDISIALRAILKREFQESVADVYVSFVNSMTATVWITSTSIANPSIAKRIKETAEHELAKFGVKCRFCEILAPQLPEPSVIAILRSVKVHAPASLTIILADLHRRGFSCPSPNWLSYKLDSARKRGFVMRDSAGRFALTSAGLEVVPWNRSASSSDVERILAIARRKEW